MVTFNLTASDVPEEDKVTETYGVTFDSNDLSEVIGTFRDFLVGAGFDEDEVDEYIEVEDEELEGLTDEEVDELLEEEEEEEEEKKEEEELPVVEDWDIIMNNGMERYSKHLNISYDPGKELRIDIYVDTQF